MPNSVYERGRTSSSESSGQKQNELQPLDDMFTYLKDYARERPEIAMFACLGIGFILGWRLKPW